MQYWGLGLEEDSCGVTIVDTENWWCIHYFQPARGHTHAEIVMIQKWEVYRETFQSLAVRGRSDSPDVIRVSV